jgi:hypothetical protein
MNENIQTLEALTFCATRISGATQGRATPSWFTMMASLAFGRLALNGLSILRLVPGSSLCQPFRGMQTWDLASVSSLGRNLIETYLTLHYFAQGNQPDHVLELRKKIWEFHEAFERLKMLRSILPQSSRLPELQQSFERRKQALEQDASFQTVPEKKRQRVLRGEISKMLSNDELCANAGVSTNYYSSVFKCGSNHTHSSPFSFAQLDSFNAGDETARCVFRTELHVATGFIALGIRDHVRLWPDQDNLMSPDEKRLVRVSEEILKWDQNPAFVESDQ